jgi:hypothetical protein
MTETEIECREWIYSYADDWFHGHGDPDQSEEFWRLYRALRTPEEWRQVNYAALLAANA